MCKTKVCKMFLSEIFLITGMESSQLIQFMSFFHSNIILEVNCVRLLANYPINDWTEHWTSVFLNFCISEHLSFYDIAFQNLCFCIIVLWIIVFCLDVSHRVKFVNNSIRYHFQIALFACIVLAAAAPQGNPDATAETVRSSADVGPESYKYEYETSNQIQAQEQGELKQIGEEKGISAHGSFKFTAPDGQVFEVTYVADENGFQPQGAHLPTPPPVPEAIGMFVLVLTDVIGMCLKWHFQHNSLHSLSIIANKNIVFCSIYSPFIGIHPSSPTTTTIDSWTNRFSQHVIYCTAAFSVPKQFCSLTL